ncbi:surface polysaccharide O-acyltransferase-like enzyme [Paenibacillus cellulosilyticus]|uniref:Surface polysaccharide O-acyltransferase-like enzyme n=1 Tax=Paenibacillus cellulosilyticus TaxID=375489 RepID=A0A2V2YRB4_9BACL|nr:acyltransferase [Paenibacillus cellulosilyticus]PWV95889.1 surface polysaccharide O-acyltransferase-like enzyme [Paenibacillus cellulosilyticus]QKS47758.1 acyltransferase [Paenibacillus cellulosilyticus]
MKNKTRKPRISELDTLRGAAFLAVVLQHAIAHYFPLPATGLGDGVLLGVLLIASKFAVPLFVFMTGMSLFYSYDGEVPYLNFIRKRLKDIALPYLPWALLYAIEFQHVQLLDSSGWQKLGLMLFTGKASYHLWYVVMVFQLYLIFPPLQRLVKRVRPRSFAATMGVLALLFGLYLILMEQGGAIYRTAVAWDVPVLGPYFAKYLDRNALMYFFYFAMGAVAAFYVEQWRAWLIRLRYAILTAFAGMAIYLLYVVVAHFQLTPQVVIRYHDLGLLNPRMAVFLTLSVLTIYIVAMQWEQGAPGWLRKIMAWLGAYSYVAYLAHAYVLKYMERVADSLFGMDGSASARTLAAFIFSAAGAALIAYALRLAARSLKRIRQIKTQQANEKSAAL